jgi:hypothetical protein
MGYLFSQVTQRVAQALGIEYLHSAWRPQSSGKVERAIKTIIWTLVKLCQEACRKGTQLLPITLLKIRNTPKD